MAPHTTVRYNIFWHFSSLFIFGTRVAEPELEPPRAALFEPEPGGGSGSGKLRKTDIIYSVLISERKSFKKPVDYLISTCHVIVYSDLMFKITNLEFSSSFIHSNFKKKS